MYKKKLEPLEILEKIKLSMNYDMGKTLNENRGVIVNEQILTGLALAGGGAALANNLFHSDGGSSYNALLKKFETCKNTAYINYDKNGKQLPDDLSQVITKYESRLSDDQITKIAIMIFGSLDGPGTNLPNLTKALKSIPTKKDFCKVVNKYNTKYTSNLLKDIDGDVDGDGFQVINSALDNAFKYKTAEESNKKAPTKSIIDKGSSSELEKKLKDSVYRQIDAENGNTNSNGLILALTAGLVDNTILTQTNKAIYKLKNNGRVNDVMNNYLESRRTTQSPVVGDKVLTEYLNKMIISLSGNGGGFVSLFNHLVDVRKGTLGDLHRLQELRYSQSTVKLWDDIVKLPYNKIDLWLKFAASLDQMKKNGSSNLKFEKQTPKTISDFKRDYPCLDYVKGVNFVGKNEGSKAFIFQKDANGTTYKFYWPILTQDKGMIRLSKSHGYYNKPNNQFNTSSDTDTGFKWSCSGSGGIGGSKLIIENKMVNLLEGNWTLPKKKKDVQVKSNTGNGQQGKKSKYRLCTGTYSKGCRDNEGIISKVQGCLGLGVDGKFGPKTEEVIYSKLNRNSFTKSDVDTLCKTGQISDPIIVEPKLIEPEVVKLTDLENI